MAGNKTTIGGLRFDGVEVYKQTTRSEGSKTIYCVWTDAGYCEYNEQKLKNGFSDAAVHAVKCPDLNKEGKDRTSLEEECGKILAITNVENCTVKFDSDKYFATGIYGDGKNLTFDARNEKKDKIIVFNDAKVLSDPDDDVTRK